MSDRGVYRGLYSSLFDDPDFQRLSSNARLAFLTIRLCRDTGPAAIFRYYHEVLMAQTGLSGPALMKAMRELSETLWIAIEGPIVWVRNGLRYDPMMKPESNELHRTAVTRHVKSLPRLQIVLTFCNYYGLPRPFDTLSIGSRVPLASEEDSDTDPEQDPERPGDQSGIAPTNGHHPVFSIPSVITQALDRAPRLGADRRIREPKFWQAEIRANPTVDYPTEILKAEAWLSAHPERHYKKLSGFLHNWLARADREADA